MRLIVLGWVGIIAALETNAMVVETTPIAIAIRQTEIEDDEVGRLGGDRLQRLGARSGFDDLIARLGFEEGDSGGRDFVGDEYLRHGDGV